MTINYNQSPYWDDYDEAKGFYKILFRPGYAVQARELNQVQSIIQKQIDRFGRHIFEDGSRVLGGGFDIETDIKHVKIDLLNLNGFLPSRFEDATVVGLTSGCSAVVRSVYLNPTTGKYVLLVRYSASGVDTSVFANGEVLRLSEFLTGGPTAQVAATSATGDATLFTIQDGVLFVDNSFISYPTQRIVVDPINAKPTATIGFKLETEIVTTNDDASLFDNAQGSTNFAAPGADRLAATLTLSLASDIVNGEQFIQLLDLIDGEVQETAERSAYSEIYEEMAKRTADESGDYYVNGLTTRTREHLNTYNSETGTSINEGLLKLSDGGDANLIVAEVEPGTAYVKGYEVNLQSTRRMLLSKSDAFDLVNGHIVTARTGGYIIVDEITGTPILDKGTVIQLRDTAEDRLTNKISNAVAPNIAGAVIGTAKVKHVIYESGTLGTATGQLRIYLFDVVMTTGSFGDVRSVYVPGSSPVFADVVLSPNGSAITQQVDTNTLVFPLGSQFTRAVKDDDGTSSDTLFFFNRTDDRNVNLEQTGGSISIDVATTSEVLPYGVGVLDTSDKRDLIVAVRSGLDVPQLGTVSAVAASSTLTGVNTFFTRLNVGDKIRVEGTVYFIDVINTNTELVVREVFDTDLTDVVYNKAFLSGDLIDLTAKGSSGIPPTVTITSPTVMNINLQEETSGLTGTLPVRVTYKVTRGAAGQINKQLRTNRYIKINCSALGSLTAPINLGVADVFKIHQIRKLNADFTSATQGSNVTSSFIQDLGQRDNIYDHATITPTAAISSSDFLLVELDHFDSDFSLGLGYFSIDSYPIDDTTATPNTILTYQIPKYVTSYGAQFDLRDCLDFRPVRTNSTTTIIASAAGINVAWSVNPTKPTTFVQDSNGLRLPVPNTRVFADYSYYLARRDVITIDERGQMSVIQGDPAVTPITPRVPDTVMALSSVFVPPYPSLSESFARIIGDRGLGATVEKLANRRHTQRQIGVLKKRIESLEYYNALNLLEKNAVELRVLDENGLDRFKNGFFVDTFADHSLGKVTSPDYNIAVDKLKGTMRPVYDMESWAYEYYPDGSTGVQQTGNLVTLPYTESLLTEQMRVTTFRNIEIGVYRFVGRLTVFPDNDVWADIDVVDKTVAIRNDENPADFMRTEWNAWQATITGYNVYDHGGRLIGNFASAAQANAAARRTNRRGAIETLFEDTRSGVRTDAWLQEELQEVGNFVTDVSVIPHIRAQNILLYARGLKANTQYFAFFDGEDMSEYLRPFTRAEVDEIQTLPQSQIDDQIERGVLSLFNPPLGTNWRSNGDGVAIALMQIPNDEKRFRIGTKPIKISESPTNDPSTVSFAEQYFYASGLDIQKQNTILSTHHMVTQDVQISADRSRTARQGFNFTPPPPPPPVVVAAPPRGGGGGGACSAYSFLVQAPINEEGVFVTSFEVYIQSFNDRLGAWFEIREMDNAGGITRNQVPYSEAWLRRDDPRINFWDGTGTPVSTKIDFYSPVFLYNDKQYALVIHTEGPNPDVYFWVSRLGEVDLLTNEPVNDRAYFGTFYITNNNLNWDMVQDIDLMFKLNRAKFDTEVEGVAVMANKPYEFLKVEASPEVIRNYGELITGSQQVRTQNLSGTIDVGDIISGVTSGESGTVVSAGGGVFKTTAHGLVNGELFTVDGKATTGTLVNIQAGQAKLRSYNSITNTVVLEDTNGIFFEGGTIIGGQSGLDTTITSIEGYNYSVTNLKPDFLNFNYTRTNFAKRGYDAASNAMGDYRAGNPDSSSSFVREKTLLSRSQELASLGGEPSSDTRITMFTASEYVSPVVDANRAHAVYVHNRINNDITGESGQFGGNLVNKYISKTVTLAEGQDAEDVIVALSLYRPPNTDVYVWMKMKHREDGDTFEDKNWIQLVPSADRFSSATNEENFIETTYSLPASVLNDGIFEYVSNGATFNGFKQFAVKVGLAGTNSALVPEIGDLRVIALQK